MRSSSLADCRVLIVDDKPVQALELEQTLHGLGYAVLGPAGSRAEALDLLHRERPNLALLDARLSDGGLVPVAEALRSFGVPFAVMSAGEEAPLAGHPLLRHAPRLQRPYHAPALQRSVRELRLANLCTQLALANRHIAGGRERLARQLWLVEHLAACGRDTAMAKVLLREQARSLRLMRQHRRYILRQITAITTEARPR